MTQYILMSRESEDAHYAKELSDELGCDVSFLSKSFGLKGVIDMAAGSKTAAVVGDECSVRELLYEVLNSFDVQTAVFINGREFLKSSQEYDIVFCGTDMPDMIGPDVIREHAKQLKGVKKHGDDITS